MRDDQIKRLFGYFKEYQEYIIPLILEIELCYMEFPTMILNEIRNFTTHIGRASEVGIEEKEVDKQLEKASRHILRIKLDCYKVLCLYYHEKYDKTFPLSTKLKS